MAAETFREGPFPGPMGQYVRVHYDDGTYKDIPLSVGSGSGTSSIDDQGNLTAPVAAAPMGAGASPGTPAGRNQGPPPGELDAGIPSFTPQKPAPTTAPDLTSGYSSSGSSGSSGYRRSGRGSYGGNYSSDSSSDPFANLPAYQNGMQHPAQSGVPLTPGGQFAVDSAQNGGGTGQQQVSVPGGAAAGPYETRGAYPPSQHSYGGDSTSGGGGHTSAAYDAIRAKGMAMADKVRSMGAGGSSSSGSSSTAPSGTSASYRRIGRLSDRYNQAVYTGVEPKVHGWAKEQHFKPGTIDAALSDPTLFANAAIPGFEAMNRPSSNAITSLPMSDLAIIAGGTSRRGLTTKAPMPRFPKRLEQAGYAEAQPTEKRILDPSKVVNLAASLYGSLRSGNNPSLDPHALMENLATAKKNSIIRQNIRTTAKTDPAAAMNSVQGYIQAALSTRPNSPSGASALRNVGNQITNMGPDLLRLKAKHMDRALKLVAQNYIAQGY